MITAEMLENAGACDEQVQLFREHFPDGTEVTIEAATSVSRLFDWHWAAENLLSDTSHEEYDRLEIEAAIEAENAIDAIIKLPRHDYEPKRDAIKTAYYNAIATAWVQGWLNDHATSVTE